MNKIKILSIAFLASVFVSHAQDIDQAKKAIDAEKFEKAKTILKTIIKNQPTEGSAFFLLGNIYLSQSVVDSAKTVYTSGLTAKNAGHLNNIGLGQIDLDNGNAAAATAKFDLATKDMKKKDFWEHIYVARAYMNQAKPDYKAAIASLKKVDVKNAQEPQVLLALGDAFYGDKNQNEAFVAYRSAFQADPTLIRAKMQLGVLLKGAKAYTEAVKSFDEVTATNPEYGPIYRELAETYYYWGANEPKNYNAYVQKALTYYEKYMSFTDYSLTSRMRHADFLILAKDYKALEIEANKMKELDKVNPRIYRYLGYSAYENGNIDVAISSLQDFVNNPANKVIAQDYYYIGLAKIKKAVSADGTTVDKILFNEGVADIKKSVDMEIAITSLLGEVGKELYAKKLFKEASAVFEMAVLNKDSKDFLLNNFYLGNSIYFDNTKTGAVKDPVALQKADVAFANVIEASPETLDAYISRARTNSLLENDEATVKYYQQYLDLINQKGPEELSNKAVQRKLVESYNSIGAVYANTDKAKAIEYFNKALVVDPANQYSLQSIQALK